jgi:hypothetical protein
MKNLQKGFAIPIIIAVIALLTLGGGAYIYTNNKVVETPNDRYPKIKTLFTPRLIV